MRYFKPNYATYINLTSSTLFKNGISIRNRCTLCCLASRSLNNNDPRVRCVNLVPSSFLGLTNNMKNPTIPRLFSSTSDEKNVEPPKPVKKNIFTRFKEMYRDYWYVLLPVHLATSAVWVAGFYYVATSGVDIPSVLEAMNFSDKIVNSMRNSSMGYWAITYGLYKIATPARYTVTLGGTTVSINYLKKWGYIKPTAELKEMYREKKQNIIDQKENIMEKVSDLRDRKDRFIERVKETQKGIQDKKDTLLGKPTQPQNQKEKEGQ